jgi:hypothetical protein
VKELLFKTKARIMKIGRNLVRIKKFKVEKACSVHDLYFLVVV